MSLWCGGHSKINNVFSYGWTVLWEGLLNLIENFNLISKIRMNLFEFIWWYQLIYSNLRLLVRDLPSAWMKSALPLSKCLPFLEELLSHYLLFFWSFVKVSAFPKRIIPCYLLISECGPIVFIEIASFLSMYARKVVSSKLVFSRYCFQHLCLS